MENKIKGKNPHFNLEYLWLKSQDNHFVDCCLCRGKHKTTDKLIFKINSEIYRIRHCPADGLMYLFPQPGQKYFSGLYNHPSYFKGIDDMYGLAVDDKKSAEVARIRVNEILKYKNSPSSILEIGCAYGHTLAAAKEAGFKIIDGAEFSKEAIKKCRKKGLRVSIFSRKFFSSRSVKKTRYDVIAMYSVLEHVENPLIFLKIIEPLLASDGIFVIRVPEMNVFGPWLSLVDHLWHFTKKSMERLLKRINLSIIDIFPSGKFTGIQHKGELKSMTIIAKKIKNL